MAARNDLYNGNISSMVTTISNPNDDKALPQGTAYRYDQLNRLVEAQAYQNLNSSNNAWENAGIPYAGLYHNSFTSETSLRCLAMLR